MLAAVFHGTGDIRLEEVDMPPAPGMDEVLMQVRACGICGTDIRIYKGEKTRGVRIPSIIGHEFSGDVVAVGDGVSGIYVGDRITAAPIVPCRSCYYCANGMENLCANRTAIGYDYDGAFAEFMLIPAPAVRSGNVVRIPETLSYEEAALAEPLSCCLASFEKNQIQLGSTVVVVGAGPIGLMHVQLARLSGAGRIIVSDILEGRLGIARQLGADIVVNPGAEDLKEVILSHTEGRGADLIIMAIGVPELVGMLLGCIRKRGTINLFAGFPPSAKASLDLNSIHYGEAIITGSSSSIGGQFKRALSFLSERKVNLRDIISHRFPLSEIHKGFEVALARGGMKVMILPS